MAADQRRKRLNGASMISYGPLERHRTKRKNLELVQSDLNMKSHVSIEWDGNHQKVVAKREQIGISWRQMKPFTNFTHNGHIILADVLAIPQEIFGLDSLSEVLSYEVWNTHLLDNERDHLMQFLPRDVEPHQVVQELLSGDNFHFGNPFMKWSASLCSGDLHPDLIVNQEQHLKSDKKAYYSQLHNYHKDMIGFLIKLKERWESCKDPEKEILQKIRRSKNNIEKRTPLKLNEFRVYDHDGSVTATSESYSWGAEEKAYSDNQISSMGQDDELQRRMLDKGFNKGKPRNLMVSSDFMLNMGARPKKGDKLHKNIHSNDGGKYMSYIKISKKQHELVKSMKLSCKSIQSSTLNRVLGDLVLDNINVQPYEVFIKEEQKKLHEHWLQLVNKHLPAAYANWTERLIQKHAVRDSLVVEMKDKSNPVVEDGDIVRSENQPLDQNEDIVSSDNQPLDQDDDIVSSDNQPLDQNEDIVSSDNHPLDQDEDIVSSDNQPLDQDEDIVSSDNQPLDQKEDGCLNNQSSSEDDEDSIAGSPENQSLHDSYQSGNDELNHVGMDSEKNILSKGDDSSQNKTEYSRIMNSQDDPISKGAPFSSDDHAWQAVEMPHSYYDSAVTHDYTANGLSLVNPQVNEEQQTRIISLESDLHREDTGKELLHRQSDDGLFSSYQSQDRSDLLHSLIKGKGVNSYHREQKRTGFNFQTSNNVMMGDSQFSSHFKEPLQTSLTLEQGQRRAGEVYVPENMSDKIYSDGGRYSTPRQDPLSAGNITGWAVNAPRMVAPSQSHVNTADFIGQHWFSSDHQVRGAWNGSDNGSLSSQSLATGGNSDQSLFSVLSQCSQLRSSSPYESVRHTGQFLAPRTYGVVDAGTTRINAVVSPSSHPLDYFSGRDTPSALAPDDMTWMSLPPQNPAINDQMGKPYLRSWNR